MYHPIEFPEARDHSTSAVNYTAAKTCDVQESHDTNKKNDSEQVRVVSRPLNLNKFQMYCSNRYVHNSVSACSELIILCSPKDCCVYSLVYD